ILLRSQDQNAELSLSWDDLDSASAPPSLELHLKLLRHFVGERKRQTGFNPTSSIVFGTSAKSPAGAGLGGSSALSIAMIGALSTWARGKQDFLSSGERLIEIARDTETTVIQVPAGLQDYYGA